MADQAEKVILEAEDQVTPAVEQANSSLDNFEKKAESAHTRVIRVTDQTRSSVQRLIASLEKQAEVYGKVGVDRLIAQRDQLLQRYAKEPAAIAAITSAYEKMIQVQRDLDKAAQGTGTGFNARYAFFGLKDVMEGRTKFAIAEAANELMRLHGTALAVGGSVAGVAALGFAAYEVAKSLKEIREEPDKIAAAFGRLDESLRASGDELRATNAHLEETIAKLQGRPENTLKSELYEARVEADKLAESLTKDLESLGKLLEQHNVSTWHQILGAAGTADIKNIVDRLSGSQDALMAQFSKLMSQTKTPKEVATLQADFGRRLKNLYDDAQQQLKERQEQGPQVAWVGTVLRTLAGGVPGVVYQNDATRRKALQETSETLNELLGQAQERITGAGLKTQKTHLEGLRDQAKQANEDRKKFETEAAAFERKGDEAELTAIEKIYYQRDLLLQQAAKVKASEAEIAAIRKAADQQASVIFKKSQEEFEKYDQQRRAEQSKRMLALLLPSQEQMKEWEEGFKAQGRIKDIGVQAQREELRRRAGRAARMAELTTEEAPHAMSDAEKRDAALRREWTAAQHAYQTRLDLAIQLADIEAGRTAKEENAANRAVMAAQAQKDLFTDLAQAQDQFEEKRAEIEHKRAEELQREIDGLQTVAAGLFHTLFTKPQDFGRELSGTIHEALLKPVTEGMGGMVASALHPLIYGQGGIASILGGAFGAAKQDPIATTADNTTATIQNSQAIWLLTAVLSEFIGRNVPALGTQGGAMPNIGVASPSGFLSQMLRNTGGLPRFAEGGVATGPSIVGEAGPELVIPLDKLLDLRPTRAFPLVHQYGPETDAALEKFATGMMNIALPAGLSALGGPAGISVGESLMSLLLGGVAAITPERRDGVMLGMVPMGPPGAAQYSLLSDRQKVGQLIRLAKMVEVSERPSQVLEYPGGKILLAPQQRFAMPGANTDVWGEGLIRDVYNAGKPAYKQRISTLGIPEEQRGQGIGQALYLAAMKHGPINWEEPFESLKLTAESSQVRAALVRKGLAEREGDWMRLTDRARELLGLEPLSGSAAARAPRDLEYMRKPKAGPRGVLDPETDWYWGEGGRDTWGMTHEQHVAAGRKGGIKSGITRLANPRDPDLDMFGNYIGPPVDAPETVHQASASIDAVAPHLKNIDWTRKAGQIKNRVLVGGDTMSLVQAGKRLGVSSMSLERELRARYPGQDWSTIDLEDVIRDWNLKSVTGRKAYRIPKHEEGGTIATTGPAIVHAGEAVVPHADTLKRSIDALTLELHSNTGVLGWFANSMIQPLLGGRAPSLPVPIPGVGTVSIPPLFGGGASETGSASTILYAPTPVSGGSTAGAMGEGNLAAGGYTPAPWAGGGTGYAPTPVAITNAVSGSRGVPGSGFNPHAMLANLKNTDWGGFTKNDKGQITGMHGVAGAAVFTGGMMVAEQGLLGSNRGTWTGVGEGAAGGAAIGFTMGGPLGALIGGVAGLGIGLGEKLAGVESPEAHASKLIKQVYGIDIPKSSGTVKQVVAIAQQEFGGQISVAVRSPGVRQLVMLYSEATGQKMPLSATTPYGGSLAEVGGNLYQQASFQSNQWHTYQSGIPTLAGISTVPYPTPGVSPMAGMGNTTIALNINGTPITPEFVMDQSMAAQGTSYGRTQQAANMQVPGLMVG